MKYALIEAAEKICIALLVALSLLLAVSFLPVGEEPREISLSELNDLGDKVSPEVKEQIALSVFEKKERIHVIVKSTTNVDSEIKNAKGKIKDKAEINELKFTEVEIYPADIVDLAEEINVAAIYPVVTYYPMLADSVPLVNADTFWNAGYTGNGVKVAVIDTGVDSAHPMLSGKVIAERDFSNSGTANDNNGHGTHVAGIIAGTTDNGGSYSGVAPDAQLLNAKVISDSTGEGKNIWLIDAISWAVANGANVISMSLGAPTSLDQALEDAISSAVASGVTVVVSSGNCGDGCPSSTCKSFRGVTMPGSSPSVISVGAVDKSKQLACFSSGENIDGVGIKPDLVAPGVDITSSIPNAGYQAKMGTSMAAPHVSGAVALLLQETPDLTPADVKHILESTSIDLGPIGKDIGYGSGMLDLSNALDFYSGLEFTIDFDVQVITGNIQHIEVRIFDDIQITEVSGTITKPDATQSAFTLASAGTNLYSYDYSDTVVVGNYVLDIVIKYPSASGSSSASDSPEQRTETFSQNFRVTLPMGDFGNVETMNIAEDQFYSKNLTGSLEFRNTAATELNVSALLQLLTDSQDIAQEIRLPVTPVAANSISTIGINDPLEVAKGNYTLRILTDFGAGSIVNETNITVVDDLLPIISDTAYNKPLFAGTPRIIVLKLVEHSNSLKVNVSAVGFTPCSPGVLCTQADGPVSVNFTTSLLLQSGNEKELVVTLFENPDEAKVNTAEIEICDESNNCVTTGVLDVGAILCEQKQLLVVKTYEEKSVFEEAETNGICLYVLNRSVSGTPPDSYLQQFDSIIWTTGNDLININDDDASALIAYLNQGGNVMVEGSDVAFKHGNDALMQTVLHAELKNDLGFTITSTYELQNLSINITQPHPVMKGLQNLLLFNATLDPFPDSVQPYNGSVELAFWSGFDSGGSAIVVYEDEQQKSLLFPFNIEALNDTTRNILASNSINWLLGGSSSDINPLRLDYGFLSEGEISIIAVVESTEPLSVAPAIEIFVDENKVQVDSGMASQNQYSYQFTTTLSVGVHTVKVVANSDFSIEESNYINNVKEYRLRVYPQQADLLISDFAYSYDDNLEVIVADVEVSNMGGTPANSLLKVYLNNSELAEQNFELAAGQTSQLSFKLLSQKGIYDFKAIIDPENSVEEYNESNNELQETLYLCSEERILVVDDNDAEYYSTSEPSSADEFLNILKLNSYCAEYFNQEEQGTPSLEYADSFPVMIWSAGDYFNNVISNEDAELIGNYSGQLLLEGSDLALDSSDIPLLQEITGTGFAGDIILNDTSPETLNIYSHSITQSIAAMGGISISKQNSPYPDSLEAVSSETIAEWNNSGAAITATADDSGKKTAYYGFSIDGVTDYNVRETLVINTVQWLLEMPNFPPEIEPLSDIVMNEGETVELTITATDPENDVLAYQILLDGTVVSTSNTFTFTPEYNESGDYNLTVIVSDGTSEVRTEITITVLDTLECGDGQTRLCSLQEGVCAESFETCTAGFWPGCIASDYGQNYEVTELSCDNLDNDCDGVVDNGLTRSSGGVGACSVNTEVCAAGVWSSNDEYVPVAEICNSVDDDCDGMVDNGLTRSTDEFGMCLVNTETCVDGAYVPNNEYVPTFDDMLCDGFDNDCDGAVDEDYVAAPTSCGVGICSAGGIASCVDGQLVDSCLPGAPSDEICDGLDNDCDDFVDEDLVRSTTEVGLCSGNTESCVDGAYVPNNEYVPSLDDLVCDGLDNDCDGLVDENIFQTEVCGNCGTQTLTCAAGVWLQDGICTDEGVCSPGEDASQLCGFGGSQSILCNDECVWPDWGICVNEGECSPGATESRDCGTTDVGICRYGTETRVCADTYYWNDWGECEGYVEPVEEIYDNLDNNCDGEVDEGWYVDLQPVAITYFSYDEPIKSGMWVYFDSGIMNTGVLNADKRFNIKWYLDGEEVGFGSHSEIDAGETVMDGNSQYLWDSAVEGEHTLRFEVNAHLLGNPDEKAIVELDYDNNFAETMVVIVK